MATEVIVDAIDRFNDSGVSPVTLEKAPGTVISGVLDSLGTVNFITTLEEVCEERFGRTIPIADAIYGDPTALETVGTLIAVLARVLTSNAT
jgi:acyl carrier protein